MDTTKPVTHISLCAGYGGIDLGLKRAIPSLRTVAFSEIEAFACANLVAKMEAGCLDPAPIWTDVKTFPWAEFHGKVDILSGGYPCQPFSAAGKRLGKDDPRHLWPWIADGISILQPALCFFENVEGHISLGLSTVVSDLEGLGYKVAFGLFSAAEVGAPHQRKRIFVLAHRIGERGLVPHQWRVSGQQMPVRDGQTRGTFLADSIKSGSQGCAAEQTNAGGLQRTIGRGCNNLWPSRPGQPQHGWEPPRVVVNSTRNKSQRSPAQRAKHEGLGGELCSASTSSKGVLGDPDCRGQSLGIDTGCGGQTIAGGQGNLEPSKRWQTEPALGGNAHGPASRLDYAKLCVSGDNRTDELRLLGNGVVPATAERAFRTLIARFFP
jgi:DNA (cytosine-5)-methyltransferase 1